MISIQVRRSIKLPVDKATLSRAAQVSLELGGSSKPVDVSVVLGNDALLQKLNRQFRAVDSTTDVLSFPTGEADPDSSAVYLGDVVISVPRAQQQAAAEGHSEEDELQLLVAHGILHLLGYDHEKSSDKKRMQAVQDEIIKQLGLNLKIRL